MAARSSADKSRAKNALWRKRKNRRCCFCGAPMSFKSATLEHIRPLAHGGGWSTYNLALSCYDCNQERGTENFDDFKSRKGSA